MPGYSQACVVQHMVLREVGTKRKEARERKGGWGGRGGKVKMRKRTVESNMSHER